MEIGEPRGDLRCTCEKYMACVMHARRAAQPVQLIIAQICSADLKRFPAGLPNQQRTTVTVSIGAPRPSFGAKPSGQAALLAKKPKNVLCKLSNIRSF
jgi:hypothetical protein